MLVIQHHLLEHGFCFIVHCFEFGVFLSQFGDNLFADSISLVAAISFDVRLSTLEVNADSAESLRRDPPSTPMDVVDALDLASCVVSVDGDE